MTTTAVSIDGTDLASVDVDVLGVVRPILPTPRDVRLDVPGSAGSVLFVEQPGDRELIVTCAYVGSSFADRRGTITEIAQLLYSDAAQKVIVDDEDDRYWRGRLVDAPTPREIMTLAQFDLRWLVEPFAQATTITTVSALQPGAGAFTVPTFTGGGDVKTAPSIEVTTGADGAPGGFTISVNGTVLTYATDMAAYETVTLSSVTQLVLSNVGIDVELTGAFDPDDVDMRDVSGDFGNIVPGSNTITITPDDGAITGLGVDIDYRKQYLS